MNASSSTITGRAFGRFEDATDLDTSREVDAGADLGT